MAAHYKVQPVLPPPLPQSPLTINTPLTHCTGTGYIDDNDKTERRRSHCAADKTLAVNILPASINMQVPSDVR